MGRHKKPDKCISIGMRLTPAFVALVDAMAVEQGLTRYAMIRDLVTTGYDFKVGRPKVPTVAGIQAQLDEERKANIALSKQKMELEGLLTASKREVEVLTGELVGAGLRSKAE